MRKLRNWFSGLILMLVFIAGIIFSYYNTEPVVLVFGSWRSQALALSVWVIGAFVAGGLLGLLVGVGVFRQRRMRKEIRRLKKELAVSRQEMKQFRALSLKELD